MFECNLLILAVLNSLVFIDEREFQNLGEQVRNLVVTLLSLVVNSES